jgi:hypothetical protein
LIRAACKTYFDKISIAVLMRANAFPRPMVSMLSKSGGPSSGCPVAALALYGLCACPFGVYYRRLSSLPVAARLSKHIAPPFLAYKTIARHLLGCIGRWGFCGIFEHFSLDSPHTPRSSRGK